jgi:hypothetical protein
VNDAFELLDPANAQAFLRKFPADARRKGQSFFNTNAVSELAAQVFGKVYSALVQDGDEQMEVELRYDAADGWSGSCSCNEPEKCAHQYAAMRALVAEHSSAMVRSLSSSRPTGGAVAAGKAKAEQEPGLARRLIAELGRPLNTEEAKFIRKVSSSYQRCRQLGHVSRWDFNEMGLRLSGYGWETLQIWPAFPADEHEFWLYVARAARSFGVAIPEFMLPISNFDRVEKKMAKWERTREVEKWNRALGSLRLDQMSARPAVRGETDLRIMIEENEARLQWLRPGSETFDFIKHAQLRQMTEDNNGGRIRFTIEAALLWQLIANQFYYGNTSHLRYNDPNMAAALGRVLRTPMLESRIINREGQPLARPADPLRWEVAPATTLDEDYRVRLVRAGGEPPPAIRCVIEGNPTLYVGENEVFTGPLPQDNLLNPALENRIPAPAIEQAAGVAFLKALGAELPERLREKVRTLQYQLGISCELKRIYPGSTSEDCMVNVVAEAADGHKLAWTGYAWQDSTPPRTGRPRRQTEDIILYDSSALDTVPILLEPLNLKPSSYRQTLSMRVTKKFPEIFIAWLKSIPPDIQVQLAGELASFAEAAVSGSVRLDVTEAQIDWFDLRVVLDVSDTTLSQEEIKLLLNAKGNYVRLEGKGWRRLQFNLSEEENERLAQLGLNPRELSAEPQRLHALQLADEAAKKFLPEQQVAQIQRRATEIKARVAPEIPAGITAELRPYQLEGFHFLSYLSTNRFGGILADDMGLGKTVQTLAWLLWLRDQNHNGVPAPRDSPSLVVCPKSVMDNWHAEAARFAPSLRVRPWPAAELNSLPNQLATADLHVINYSQLRLLGESLLPVRWHTLILDEGQYIKNPSSQTAQVARALRAEHRLILSGTPIENRLTDLWSLMAFAMPGVLGSRAQFVKLYDAKGDPFARRRLSSRVRPFLLRRTKAQVAKDLPDRIEEDLFCEIEGEQKTLYRAELKRAQQILLRIKTQKELASQQFHFLTSLLRLRQICCHPRLIHPESSAPSAKTEALLEQLEPIMEEGQKVLVFSQFVQLLDLLQPAITERGWPTFYLAGDTENRGDLVREFQATEGPAIFLISLKAGGFGLNLTAASYVVLFDPWWNPAVENQAIDRTHRIGQVNKVIAYRLLIKDSIEEKIRELQKQKKALAQDVLGEERFAQSLTINDLQFLFAE